jgi:hypothetical protein
MKPPEHSRLADEKAAFDLQRKKPSGRRLWSNEQLALLVTAGLIAFIFLIGWLLGVR